MKKTLFYVSILALSALTSCTAGLKDDIEDLQNEVSDLEDQLAGSYFDPITISHDYSYDDDTPISESFALYASSSEYQTIEDYGDNEYYVEIANIDGPAQNSYAYLGFDYNATTGDVSDVDASFERRNIYNDYVSIYMDDSSDYIEYDLEVISFNASTGKVKLELTGEYTEDYDDSEYGTAGTFTLSFNGTLKVVSYPSGGMIPL